MAGVDLGKWVGGKGLGVQKKDDVGVTDTLARCASRGAGMARLDRPGGLSYICDAEVMETGF